MIKFVLVAFCAYLFGKLSLFKYGPGRGFGRNEPERGVRDWLRAGEPALGVIAIVICASLILWGGWYTHRASERLVLHGTNCYAELEAAIKLPRIRTRFSLTDIWDGEMSSKDMAEQEAPNVGLSRDALDNMLNDQRTTLEQRYSRLVAQGDQRSIDAQFDEIGHCLNDDFDAG